MLSCADFLAEFGDYLEDVADPDLRTRLEEHLRECKTCEVIVDSTAQDDPNHHGQRFLHPVSRQK